jgi:hypothetical protein
VEEQGIQDAKVMSKTQDEKKDYAHIKYFKCEDMGHFASRCLLAVTIAHI